MSEERETGVMPRAERSPRSPSETVAVAEFDLDGVLRHADDNYPALMGFAADEIASGHRPPSIVDPARRAFWADLRRGIPRIGIEERSRPGGGVRWLEESYIPLTDGRGRVRRVLKIARDVTERLRDERERRERMDLLSFAADATDTAVLVCDAGWRALYVNEGFTRLLGWEEGELAGRFPIDILFPGLERAAADEIRAVPESGRAVEREEILTGRNGRRRWVKVVVNPISAAGASVHVVATLTDITNAKLREALQRRALEAMARERPLSEVLELICVEVERVAPEITASILEVDERGRLHPLAAPGLPDEYSRSLDGMTMGPKAGSCGTAAWRNEPVMVDDIETDPLWEDFRRLILPLGYRACWSTPIRNNENRPIGTFALYFRRPRGREAREFHQRLIDACAHLCALALERERERRRIRQLAFYDTLTGLPNRDLLLAAADRAIASAAGNNERLAVLFIDLDRFKRVNDSLGHAAGDELLRRVADALRSVAGPGDIIGRLTGDEFVVVLPGCDAERAADAATRSQALLARATTLAGTAVSVSAGVGIALFPADGRDVNALLNAADTAMAQAKRGGRGGFRFFSEEMNRRARDRLTLENALRHAVENKLLHLHYQPQFELAKGRLHGVEALARWRHPELGSIPPAEFIPMAEDCGLIAALGRWALDEACRQLAAWRNLGLAIPTISVNLSSTSFHDPDLPQVIDAVLRGHGLRPADLIVELTESVSLDTHPNTSRTVDQVHARGIRLSMDDFGTGYSSLSYLRRLPVDELKVDRGFVADLETDAAARALSGAILGIGTGLNLTVVAEGVETPGQNALLREQGYPVAQGYLFAPPMAPGDLARRLAETNLHVEPS